MGRTQNVDFESHSTGVRNICFLIFRDPRKIDRDAYSAELKYELQDFALSEEDADRCATIIQRMQQHLTADCQLFTSNIRIAFAAGMAKGQHQHGLSPSIANRITKDLW
jgi:hypothetical protein